MWASGSPSKGAVDYAIRRADAGDQKALARIEAWLDAMPSTIVPESEYTAMKVALWAKYEGKITLLIEAYGKAYGTHGKTAAGVMSRKPRTASAGYLKTRKLLLGY